MITNIIVYVLLLLFFFLFPQFSIFFFWSYHHSLLMDSFQKRYRFRRINNSRRMEPMLLVIEIREDWYTIWKLKRQTNGKEFYCANYLYEATGNDHSKSDWWKMGTEKWKWTPFHLPYHSNHTQTKTIGNILSKLTTSSNDNICSFWLLLEIVYTICFGMSLSSNQPLFCPSLFFSSELKWLLGWWYQLHICRSIGKICQFIIKDFSIFTRINACFMLTLRAVTSLLSRV